METKRILICDDHQILREGIIRFLQEFDKEILVSEASTAKDAFDLLEQRIYNILILDLSLPDMDGLEVLKTVKSKWPETNVLMLSMKPTEQYAVRCLQLGAAGYLNKEIASHELIIAVETIFDNQTYISKSQVALIAKYLNKTLPGFSHENLSVREFQIFIKLAEGKTLQEIASETFISVKTVSTYKARILTKMNLKTTSELTRYSMEKNLI